MVAFSRNILLSVLCLCCFSCQNNKKNELTGYMNEWMEKVILFPSSSSFWINGCEEIHKVQNSTYSIVSYIDSIGCTSCKLNYAKWDQFCQELHIWDVPVYLYIHPNQQKQTTEIRTYLYRHKQSFWACIDLQDSLNVLNHFPSETAFQTFLLDKDNKVVAIGNPIHNPKVKELYLKIIKGETIGQENTSKQIMTKAVVDKSFIQMGSFDWQEEQKAAFTLKNTGNKVLVIQDIVTSCGCTTVSYSKEPVQPGKEVTLEVAYKAEHPGYFDKTVTVYCNAEGSPLKLRINGNAQ